MKNKIIKLTIATALFVCGASYASINQNRAITPVEAATHVENFDPYTYSGTYYDALDKTGTEGLYGTFRSKLSSYIFPKGWYTYGGGGSDHLSTILQSADEDPTNKSNMIYLYTRDSVKKNAASSWNREHVWPQSLSRNSSGVQHWGTSQAGTDILHIRPTYSTTNGERDNDKYGNTNKSNPLTYNGMPYGYETGTTFEPLDSVKGDVARIIMYVWTAYYDYYNDSSLLITKTFTNYDTLLEWHMLDKPDVHEGYRNDFSQTSRQKNRNPFVDHPEYAWKIFGDSASADVKNRCKQTYPGNEKIASKIEISGEATKKQYTAGESFDPTGLTVTATYTDNTTAVIANDKCSWEPKKLRAGLTSVTCKYDGLSATYSGITVVPGPTPEIQGTYGIVFIKDNEEATIPVTANEVLTGYTANNTLVEEVTSAQSVYPSENGLQIDNRGSIVFKLKDVAKTPDIQSVYFVSKQGTEEVEVDVKLNDEDISFSSADGVHTINIAGYFDEGLSTITISTTKAFELCEFGINVKQKEQPVPQPSSSSSSEAPTSESSIPESSSSESSSSQNGDSKKKGCNGSIIAVASLTGLTTLIGSVLLLSKKRRK